MPTMLFTSDNIPSPKELMLKLMEVQNSSAYRGEVKKFCSLILSLIQPELDLLAFEMNHYLPAPVLNGMFKKLIAAIDSSLQNESVTKFKKIAQLDTITSKDIKEAGITGADFNSAGITQEEFYKAQDSCSDLKAYIDYFAKDVTLTKEMIEAIIVVVLLESSRLQTYQPRYHSPYKNLENVLTVAKVVMEKYLIQTHILMANKTMFEFLSRFPNQLTAKVQKACAELLLKLLRKQQERGLELTIDDDFFKKLISENERRFSGIHRERFMANLTLNTNDYEGFLIHALSALAHESEGIPTMRIEELRVLLPYLKANAKQLTDHLCQSGKLKFDAEKNSYSLQSPPPHQPK